MDIYVICNPLLFHTVRCLPIALRLVWHWAHVLYKGEWWGPGTLGASMASPPSLTTGKTGRGFHPPAGSELCLGPLLSFSEVTHSVLGAVLTGSWRLRRGPAPPRVSVCLVPDFFHLEFVFSYYIITGIKKKKKPQMLQKDIKEDTLPSGIYN